MGKGRLESFSDGGIAIIVRIMVLELKVPHQADLADLAALTALWPVVLSHHDAAARMLTAGVAQDMGLDHSRLAQ